jgi:RNA recognition motif-containing protein
MANPVGEDSWLAYLDETIRNATDLEKRVHVVEFFKLAVGAEPASLRIWLAYCNYFWSLWADSQSDTAGWPEEEQMMGRELFSFGSALDLWQQGYEAIKYRISDSHLLWNRWISLEMEQLEKTKTPEGVKRITHLYRDRLITPHLTWDDTSQMYSSFLSEYNRAVWEEAMKDVTALSQDAKRLMAKRDSFELKLQQTSRDDDVEAQKRAMIEYLEWETSQTDGSQDSADTNFNLCCGLYARALTGIFASDESIWHEHIVFLSSSYADSNAPEILLNALRRAVQHCPWSGRLWNRLILCAEEAKLDFSEVESIKHAATSENQLYKHGMESMIEMYVAWCGFLKRTAMDASATDEAVDVADVGLSAALEDVDVVGKRLYGKDFQGDPKFRLERIYIQYLTEKKRAIDEARLQWNKLAKAQIHADSHDFWFRYYMWEMLIFSSTNTPNSITTSSAGINFRIPVLATAVLQRAVSRPTIDWPEKVLDVYMQHCNDYELSHSVRRAADAVQKAESSIAKRRTLEQEEKAAAYTAYYGAQPAADHDEAVSGGASPGQSKRKREDAVESQEHAGTNKRQKSDYESGLRRDRENTSVIVTNLPAEVTQTKLRQYFKEYGHINNITAFVREKDGQSSTALIEFSVPDEAQSALLRDGKFFGQSQITVQSGHDLTIYVANYPPTADEDYIRQLFQDCGDILSIRWPSLKVNSHRRFCYVSFRDNDASAKAVAKEGTLLNGKYKLLAKYSDPNRKKNREGAVAEGREVHVSGLNPSTTEEEIREVFSKYGTITRINIPRSMSGKGRGFAFVDFETKDEAEKATVELNKTKLFNQILQVEVSKPSNVKPTAYSISHDPESPALHMTDDVEGDKNTNSSTSAVDITTRTIALMGLADTVNDARVRALVEPYGPIIKLVLQPSHGGARIEFADSSAAGKASLQLSNKEFEGRKLRVGSLDDLRHAKAERVEDRIVSRGQSSAKKDKPSGGIERSFIPSSIIRRPTLGRPGPKRGLGFQAPRVVPISNVKPENENKEPAAKSNADFKELFLKSSAPKEDNGNGD